MRLPLIDATGTVVNVVLAGDDWRPPAGLITGPPGGEIGDRFANGSYTKPPVREATLADLKAELLASVDNTAESMRSQRATPYAGQAMTYQEKFAQANAIYALGMEQANALTPEQAAQSFPIVAASIGIEGATLWDVAQLVLTRFQEWAIFAGQIERARLSGKKAINESASVEAANAAHEAIQWPI